MTLAERLEKQAEIARRAAESSDILAALLKPEMDKFNAGNAPWDTYTVRMAVDHIQSAKRDRQLVQDLSIAAAMVRAAGDRP